MWRPSASSILLFIVMSLITLGVIMLYSTSGVLGVEKHGDAFWYLKRQLIWVGLSVSALLVTSRIDYQLYRVFAVPLALFSIVLLVMAITPGVGVMRGGSWRWLSFGPVNFQPSELAKLSCVILVAWWMSKVQRDAGSFRRGLAVPLLFVSIYAVLIILEPDFGTTMLVGAVGLTVMFVGGTRVGYLLVAGVGGLCAMALLIAQDSERRARLLAFLEPEKYSSGDAFQLMQALYAFVTGGGMGVGLGESMQKRHYLPEAHTDFIFAILGEELGLQVTLPVLIMFLMFFVCGVLVANNCEDRFGKLLGFGIAFLITVQAAINIGVVTGSLPTKGITLPFISFGGSSMLMTLAMVGILINISFDVPMSPKDEDRRIVKDRARHV
jgi:cell division protein FtsW